MRPESEDRPSRTRPGGPGTLTIPDARCPRGQALAVVPCGDAEQVVAVRLAYRIASYLTSAGLRVAVRRSLRSGRLTAGAVEPLTPGLARWVDAHKLTAQLVMAVLLPWRDWTSASWSRSFVFERVLAVGSHQPPARAVMQWTGPRLALVGTGDSPTIGRVLAAPWVARLACELMVPVPDLPPPPTSPACEPDGGGAPSQRR